VAAELDLALVIRRRVDGNDHVGAEIDDLVRRVVFVKPLGPKGLVVPKILANDDAELDVADLEYPPLGRGLEISRVVKNVVLGQERLILKPKQLTIVDHRGAVK